MANVKREGILLLPDAHNGIPRKDGKRISDKASVDPVGPGTELIPRTLGERFLKNLLKDNFSYFSCSK